MQKESLKKPLSPADVKCPSLFVRPTFWVASKPFPKIHLCSCLAMSSTADSINPSSGDVQNNYPVPISPLLPPISKQIELGRAMAASSRSKLFALSRSDVLYEDEWLIAINKPQGIYCEAVLESIPRLLLDEFNGLKGGSKVGLQPELHLANRLDRDTSGVMVITKSHKVASELVKAFTDHKVSKTYIALCIGSAPNWEKITVKSGHGRSKFGAWRVYAASDVGRTLPGGSLVKDMETSFEVLSVNGHVKASELRKDDGSNIVVVEEKAAATKDPDSKKDEILIRAFPQSGRTHQIRLHCQYLGIPLRGDVKYEGVYEWNGRVYDGHELHAECLSLKHPITDLPLTIHAPLPLWGTI